MTPEILYYRLLDKVKTLLADKHITALEQVCLTTAIEVAYEGDDEHLQRFIDTFADIGSQT